MRSVTVGLAAIRRRPTIEEGIERVEDAVSGAAAEGVEVVCFPETYVPGLRGGELALPEPDQAANEQVLERFRAACERHGVVGILGMEWCADGDLYNRAYVVDDGGEVLGYQTKNQLYPGGESENYEPDGRRQVFEWNGLTFGVSICHEGWRYPETVRWAATRGAEVVFQPQWTGWEGNEPPDRWGRSIYERAMQCRAAENTVYFASVNVAMDGQNSATSLIDPDGRPIAHVPYGEEQLMVEELDLRAATREFAKRYDPSLYPS